MTDESGKAAVLDDMEAGTEFPHISSYVTINSEFLLLAQFSTICSECNLNQNSHHFCDKIFLTAKNL